MLFNVTSRIEAEALYSGPGQNDVLPPLLFHLPVLRTLRLDEVFRVRPGRFQTNEERDALLGGPAEAVTGLLVGRWVEGHGSLEVVNPLHSGSHQRLRPGATCGVDRQWQLQKRISSVLEVVVGQRFYSGKGLQHFDDVRLVESEQVLAGNKFRENFDLKTTLFKLFFFVYDDAAAE